MDDETQVQATTHHEAEIELLFVLGGREPELRPFKVSAATRTLRISKRLSWHHIIQTFHPICSQID